MPRAIQILIRLGIALAIVAAGVYLAWQMILNVPEPKQRPAERVTSTVEALELQPTSFQVVIPSQGIIKPRTTTRISSEVSGRIMETADAFLAGGSFKEGDLLLQIDPRDQETAVQRAEASLLSATTARVRAEANVERARADWERLNLGGEPSDLALGVTELNGALAAEKAAQADLAEARLNLERCQVRAPFDGRVLEKLVDVGQVISPNTLLAELFSTEVWEVRLPLRNDQLEFLDLESDSLPDAILVDETGQQFRAKVTRTDAAVDSLSRQLFVYASIDSSSGEGRGRLTSGRFVEAEISGEVLKNVYRIPRSAVRTGRQVQRISDQGTLEIVELDVVWNGDPDELVVSATGSSLAPGDRISVTPLPWASDGYPVVVEGETGEIGREGRPERRNIPVEEGSAE